MCDFRNFLNNRGIAWTMENPTNSWLWELPCIEFLMSHMFFTTFHSCAYGGKRLKSTSFFTNNPVFLVLCLQCDGQHEHLPWGTDMETQQFQQLWRLNIPNCGRRLCHNLLDLVISMLLNDKPNLDSKNKLCTQQTPAD